MSSNELYYEMIFKRKSFHLFKETGTISQDELSQIEKIWNRLVPLYPEIKTAIKIVPGDKTTCKRGQEYCILLYSEKKENFLMNIGYLGQQLDLELVSMDIGTLWFGIGKTEEQIEDLEYVIMFAIAKMPKDKFRKDMFKSKRKSLDEIWRSTAYLDVAEIVRFSPSACNTQPWVVKGGVEKLDIYRYKKSGKRGIMPESKVSFYNRIDIGIFLLILETCVNKKSVYFERILHNDQTEEELNLVAEYYLKPYWKK